MLRLLPLVCAVALLAAACGSGGGYSNGTPRPSPTSAITGAAPETPKATDANTTPPFSGLLDDVINLAVQLNAMTHDQAVCVFQDHPNIYQDFLQTTGLTSSTSIDEITLKQQFQDLKEKYAVQLDSCFSDFAG